MERGKIEAPTRNPDIKYFHCLGRGHIASQIPNKWVMITEAYREVETDNESEDEKLPPLEYGSDEEIGAVEGEAIMVRRSLSVKIK